MYFNELSIWGGLLVVLLLLLVCGMLWVIDRRWLLKLFSVRLLPTVRRLPRNLLLPLVVAWLVGGLLMAACLMLCLPKQLFWPVTVVLLGCLATSVPQGLTAYLRSVRHTTDHRRYLLANGATHMESLVPSARRALRAALLPLFWHRWAAMPLAMLLLCCGLKAGGTTLAAALASTLLTWAAAVVAAVVACLLCLWLADRLLFDKHENLIAASDKP